MKYRLGTTIIEAIDTYVRITVRLGLENEQVQVSKKECPTSMEVAELLSAMKYGWSPDAAHLQLCGRAADDARNNKTILAL